MASLEAEPGRRNSPVLTRAFSLIECMVAVVVAVLLALVLFIPGSKERARRSSCANNLRQFITTAHLYATDHQERVFSGLDDLGLLDTPVFRNGLSKPGTNSHTIAVAHQTMTLIDHYASGLDYAGKTNLMYCPGYRSHFPNNNWFGFTIGYNYLGGHTFAKGAYPAYAPWISPMRFSDDSSLPLIADANHWAVADGWTCAPHGRQGPITDPVNGSFHTQNSAGAPSAQLGAKGGNVGYLNGAVLWKNIGKMQAHVASSHDDKYIGAW